jgi:DNA-binding NtrC family response regulator
MNIKHIKSLQEKFGLLGKSQEIYDVVELIETAAPTNISVLILGESGTGKEVVAQAIHKMSTRKHENFVAINCGALPDNLIDSELFGYEKGAFTGAVAQKKGLFEVADGGTIFLDELGEMPLKTQVRLLRVLETGELVRVGGTESIKVNARVIAATNKNLDRAIADKEFRRDLYFRLKAITIPLPELHERKEDIPILIDHFIRQFILSNHVIYAGFESGAEEMLYHYSWPGNVRELKNTVETLLVLAKGEKISEKLISGQLKHEIHEASEEHFNTNVPVPINKSSDQVERELIYQTLLSLKMDIQEIKTMLSSVSYRQVNNSNYSPSYPENGSTVPMIYEAIEEESENLSMEEMEKEMIQKALIKFEGNRRKAAKALNISERTLYRKIREFGL